jgi:hypothetical protein
VEVIVVGVVTIRVAVLAGVADVAAAVLVA